MCNVKARTGFRLEGTVCLIGHRMNIKTLLRGFLLLCLIVAPGAAQTAGAGGAKPPLVSEVQAKQAVKHKVDPEYPATARQFRITGNVVAQFTIGLDGKVESVDSVVGNLLLTESVKTALRKWEFTPFELNGKPIRVRSTITFAFKL
jgi:TonB family protein